MESKKKVVEILDKNNPKQLEMYEQLDAVGLTPEQAAQCVSKAFRKVKKNLSEQAVYYLQSFVDLYETNLKLLTLDKDYVSCAEVVQLALDSGLANGMEKIPNGELRLAVRSYLKTLANQLVKTIRKGV